MLIKSLVFIIMILSIAVPVSAHKPVLCFEGCHGEKGFSYGDETDECGNCHAYKLNVPILEQKHNPQICKGCHLPVKNAASYHILHTNVSCQNCHVDGNRPKANINDCVSCHGVKVHDIHEKKLKQICSVCHGSAASSLSLNGQKSITDNIVRMNYQRFTLYEMLKKLLEVGIRA